MFFGSHETIYFVDCILIKNFSSLHFKNSFHRYIFVIYFSILLKSKSDSFFFWIIIFLWRVIDLIGFKSEISKSFFIWNKYKCCSVGWGCRIHRLHFCRGVRPRQWVSCIWHQTIWWWGSSNVWALGNAERPFITIALKFILARRGNTW